MKLSSLHPSPRLKLWLVAMAACIPLASACSDDEETPTTPTTYTVRVVDLESGDAETAKPRCDGTLAVAVAIRPREPAFTLRPPHACGSSKTCGFVRAEALSSTDEVLATAESVTTTAVLQLDPARLSELERVRVSLVRGFDGELVTNPDGAAVTSTVQPTVTLPTDCEPAGAGGAGGQSAGAGGAGGQAGAGGAGGQAGEAAGFAGSGAGGAAGAPSDGGAPAGGTDGAAGAGGQLG